MLRIASSVALAWAAAACSVDARSPEILSSPSQTGTPADTGARPGVNRVQPSPAGTPSADGTAPTAVGPAPSGTSGQDAPGSPPAGLGTTPPQTSSTSPLVPCTDPTVGYDALFQLAQADLLQQNPADRGFTRYVSMTNQTKVAACAEQLEQQRAALAEGLNMLSLNATIATPTPINGARTIYRIDLRDAAWNRALQIADKSFGDVWEAIAAASPFAVAFTGRDADALAAGTGTRIPILFADQLLSVALTEPLYYAIIGVNASAPAGDFILGSLGIDLTANLQNGRLQRAGTTQSGVFRQSLIVERDALGIRSGFLWRVLLPRDTDAFAPEVLLGLPATDGEAMFSLPNGMIGFFDFDQTGKLVTNTDFLLDGFRPQRTVTCLNCHGSGLLPVLDEAKATALSAAFTPALTSDQVNQLQAIYVEPDVFARTLDQDSAAYQSALRLAGVTPSDAD